MKKLCYIFPGQGSQKVGMAKTLYDTNPLAQEMIDAASERLGLDMHHLMCEPNDQLDQTQFAQPAILLYSMIHYTLASKLLTCKPVAMLGHSLGEITALCATGVLPYLDALSLVHQRGLLMQRACEGKDAGMMALIGIDDARAQALTCKAQEAGKALWVANYNADGQIVIAGKREDLLGMEVEFKAHGAKKCVVLPMSVASHCPLLASSRLEFERLLSSMIQDQPFIAPIYSNVTTQPYESASEARELLSLQLVSPVHYKQTIVKLSSEVDAFVEFGGNVLKGLNKRNTEVPTLSVSDAQGLEELVHFVNQG